MVSTIRAWKSSTNVKAEPLCTQKGDIGDLQECLYEAVEGVTILDVPDDNTKFAIAVSPATGRLGATVPKAQLSPAPDSDPKGPRPSLGPGATLSPGKSFGNTII